MHTLLEKGIEKVDYAANKSKMNELKKYTQNLLMAIDEKILFIKDNSNYTSKEGILKIADLVSLENDKKVIIAIGEKATQIEEGLAKFSINPSERRFAGVVLAEATAEYKKDLKLAKQNEKHYAQNNNSARDI